MNNFKILFSAYTRLKPVKSCRNFHIQVLCQRHQNQPYYGNNVNYDNSLFFTNITARRREKKVKKIPEPLHSGVVMIDCKNKELNHFKGVIHKKFDVIPLASKGWAHKKSKGDYFSFIPYQENLLFQTKGDLPETFEEIGISNSIVQQLNKINVTHPSVIQAKALPTFLSGSNVFMCSECGSGKTLAYLMGMIENILKWKDEVPKKTNLPLGVIILHSAELASQVGNLATSICTDLGLQCHCLITDEDFVKSSQNGKVDILVCTTNSLQEALSAHLYSTKYCKHVVLDDAHLVTLEGHFENFKELFEVLRLNFTGLNNPNVTSNTAQICFASSVTSSKMISNLYSLIEGNPMEVVSTSHVNKIMFNVPQKFLRVGKASAPVELLKIVKSNVKTRIPTLIFRLYLKPGVIGLALGRNLTFPVYFSQSPDTANWITFFLKDNNIESALMTKSLDLKNRLNTLGAFESGYVSVVSATDIMSLGLNLPKLRHVVNYEFPKSIFDYIYISGRVGRVGQNEKCWVTSFVKRKYEVPLVQKIEKAVRTATTPIAVPN